MDAGGKSGGIKSDINVTPLVDIVLVLLIIFIVITPAVNSSVKLPLVRWVPPELQLDVALFIHGGLAILRAIRQQNYDVWTSRPAISKETKLRLLLKCWWELKRGRVLQETRRILKRAIRQGGTTVNDYLNSHGETGLFQVELTVYGREGEPCRRCGKTIKRVVQAGRSTFFCPGCQF